MGIALFCEKQAKKGGITTLAKFSNIYDQLKIEIQELGEALYSDNIIELEGVKGSLTRSFFHRLEGHHYGIVLPVFVYSLHSNEKVIALFKKIIQLAHKRSNQIRFKLKPGQLLVIDNFRVMHGRTKFNLSDERILYRFCFKMPMHEKFLNSNVVECK